MARPGFFAVLPASVRYDKRLTAAEKLFYAELTAMSNAEGYCYASNDYFTELFEVNESTLRRWLTGLKKYGYIDVEIIKNKQGQVSGRRITPVPQEVVQSSVQKCTVDRAKMSANPPCKNARDNNTRILNNTKSSSSRLDESKRIDKQQPKNETMTTPPVIEKAEQAFGQLTAYQRKRLLAALSKLGTELMDAIIDSCLANGAKKCSYLLKALDKAEAQGITTVEEYTGRHQRVTGKVVDRPSPSGHDILRDALNQPIDLTWEE